MESEKKLTSLKLQPELLDEFKVVSVRTRINLQKLTERAMFLYITNGDFRKTIDNQLNSYLTGSN